MIKFRIVYLPFASQGYFGHPFLPTPNIRRNSVAVPERATENKEYAVWGGHMELCSCAKAIRMGRARSKGTSI